MINLRRIRVFSTEMGRRTTTLSRPAETAAFLGILLLALALRVGTAMFLRNYSNTDEVYQYLEPAHRLVFGYRIVAWEFREGLRSWIIPGFIAGIIKAAAALSDDPKFYLGTVGACLSLLALPIVAIAYAWGRRFYGISGAIICGLLAATWPELVYFAPKVLYPTSSRPMRWCSASF
jgi:phosphatidylinositol glycan class B